MLRAAFRRPTSRGVTELDHVEVLAADRATVGPFDPGLQAVVVQIMTARKEMGNLARIFITPQYLEVWPTIFMSIRSWRCGGYGRRGDASAKVS